MPNINILIGIGGTGSKIVESALALFTAGVGPESVIVGLVDQDGNNGNCGRAANLLDAIVTARADWIGAGDQGNRLDPRETDLLSIAVQPLDPGGPGRPRQARWWPEEIGANIHSVLNVKNSGSDRQSLFDLLFASNDSEQFMDLAEGYQGRAHVGAAALTHRLTGSWFTTRLTELLNQAAADSEVRVFFAGSAFGGTGAAGFPTLARSVNRLRTSGELRAGGTRRIGGVLMLPYFTFNPPEEGETVIRSEETAANSRVALEFYERLLKQEQIFDRLYLGGWNSRFLLNYHEAGGANQKNPPLPPELFAALAAIDFFAEDGANLPDLQKPGQSSTVQIRAAIRADAGTCRWSDLPEGVAAREALGRLLRLAAYWHVRQKAAIERHYGILRAKPAWRKLLPKDAKSYETAKDHLSSLFKTILEWAASMQLFGGLGFELWNLDALRKTGSPEDPKIAVTIHERETVQDFDLAFLQLVPDAERGTNKLYDEICSPQDRQVPAQSAGLGRLVAALHHAARLS